MNYTQSKRRIKQEAIRTSLLKRLVYRTHGSRKGYTAKRQQTPA